MEAILQQFLNPAIAAKVFPYLLKGFGTTLLLSLLVVPLGLAGGLAVAVLPTLRRRWLSWLVIAYVDFFRAFPPLVLLLFIYFGAPFLGVNLPAILAVALGFLLNTSSYYGEIFRAGIESVPRGQWEAARSTGLSWRQAMAHVVVPQATRNVLPDLISNTLEVVKLTTLASVVAIPELLNAARNAQALTYNPTPIVLAALIYLVALWPIVRLISRLEHKAVAVR
ncbi:MAG TPA: amino acid ABC transporter permease [Burkholderiales bacterium]|nr:amino acid ABC transporter permease [Burkholderiales bacterium]